MDGSSGGTFTNSGTIRSENGSNVSILFCRLAGGTLDNTGSSGAFTLNNGTLRDVTIAAGSTVTTGANLAGLLENTLINHGNLSPSNGEVIYIASDTTLSGGGAITLLGISSKIYNLGSNLTLTNTDNLLRGAGQIGYNTLSVINGAVGIIQADLSGQSLQLNGSGAFTNNGLMRAQNGGTLVLDGSSGATFTNNATIRSENGSRVSILSSKLVGGTLDNTGSTGTIALNSGTLRDVTIAAGSTVITEGSAVGLLENTLINHGTLSLPIGHSILVASDTTLSGGGAIALPGIGSKINNQGSNRTLTNTDNVLRGAGQIGYGSLSVINGAAGIIQADVSGQTLELDGSGTFINNGLFVARNGGTLLRSSGTFTNFSGTTLTGGTYLALDSTLNLNIGPVVFNAATVILSGPSSIFTPINSIGQNDGTFVITNGRTFGATPSGGVLPNVGTLILGPNNSSLTVTGGYSQGAGSVLEIVLGADYPNANFHHMNVTGSASLAGTLEVKLANGYVPAPGQMFEIIHAGAINSGFVTVRGATVTYTATGVFINATGNTNALALTKAVSRKTHGPAGALDIDLPLTGAPGVECRSSGGNHTLVFTFSNNLVSGNASYAGGMGTVSGSPSFAGKTMTVNLAGVANAQTVAVTLHGLTDVFSQVLPDQTVSMGVLVGDTNGDGVVNSGDSTQTKTRSGQPTDGTNFRSDVNEDGTINGGDSFLVKSRSGTSLP